MFCYLDCFYQTECHLLEPFFLSCIVTELCRKICSGGKYRGNENLFFYLILYILNLSNLEEFFNSLITTWVTTPSGVPSSCLLGYVLCEVCWVQ